MNRLGNHAPSGRQLSYIVSLAASAGLRVDVSRVVNSTQASKLIGKLRLLNNQVVRSPGGEMAGDERAAFRSCVELVFREYLATNRFVNRSENFWEDVRVLYREFRKNEAQALSGFEPANCTARQIKELELEKAGVV